MIAVAFTATASGQQSGQHLVTGYSDFVGLDGNVYTPLLVEAGPDHLYWLGGTYYRNVQLPLGTRLDNYFHRIYFIKYDKLGEALHEKYLTGANDIIDAFSFNGGLTIVASATEEVTAQDGKNVPIFNASKQEFIASYDTDGNLQEIEGIWNLDQFQNPNSEVMMDKRDGTIYLAGSGNQPFNLAGNELIGEDWNDYLYVLKFDRDLKLPKIYTIGFDSSTGENGYISNLTITPDVNGNVVIHGSYESDQPLVFETKTLPVVDGMGLFALKLDKDLEEAWVHGGTLNGWGYYDEGSKAFKGLALQNGDLIIAGSTNTGYFKLGGAEAIFKNAIEQSNLFVYRLAPDGEVLWTRQFQNMQGYYKKKGVKSTEFNNEIGWDVVQWNDEVMYLTGIFQSDTMEVAGDDLYKKYDRGIFVASLDLDSSDDLWGYALSSDYNTGLYGFDLDIGGNVSLMGRTGGFQNFDEIGEVSVPGTVLTFHLGLDYKGKPLWYNNAHLQGLGYAHSGADLEVLRDGEVFSSMTTSTADDALTIGGKVLTSQYQYNAWLVGLVADNKLGGTVKDKAGNPIHSGYVKAYKSTKSGAYPAVDSAQLDEGGSYLFEGLYPGGYRLLAIPHLLEYPDGMPTYFGDVIGWDQVDPFDVTTETNAVSLMNITMSEVPKLTPEDGSGAVAGNVSYEEESNLKGTLGRPVTRTSVILKKKAQVKSTLEDDVVAYVITDDFGNFYFVNVPDGDYILIVDIPGLEMLEEHEVTIQGNQIVSGLDYTVSKKGIYTYTGVGITIMEQVPFRMYPNPGNGLLQIEFPDAGDYQLRVFNAVGQLVTTWKYRSVSGLKSVDLRGWNDGLYIIQVEGDNGSGTLKYMKR